MDLFILSSLLLAITTTVQSKTFIPLDDGTSVVFGSGYQEDQLPITECIVDTRTPEQVCHVQLLTGEKCRFTIGDKYTTRAHVQYVYQLLNNKVIIISDEFEKLPHSDDTRRYTKITPMDMNVCLSFDIIREEVKDTWENTGPHIAVFARTFDLIVDGKIKEYNRDAFLMKEQPFLFRPRYSVSPFSAHSQSKNLFIVSHKDGGASLNLVSHSGKLIKKLLDLGRYRESVSYGSHSLYAFCWTSIVAGDTRNECRQFDESGNVRYSEHVNTDGFNAIRGVRNLKNGGVVLFMFTNSGEHFEVVKMLPNREAVTMSYELPKFSPLIITDFDEDGGTFKIAFEQFSKQHGHGVLIKEFKIPLL